MSSGQSLYLLFSSGEIKEERLLNMKNRISESPQALVPSCELSISALQSVMIRRLLKRRQLRPDDVLSWSVV